MASDVDDIVVPKGLAHLLHGLAREAAPGKDSQRFGRLILPHLKQTHALARCSYDFEAWPTDYLINRYGDHQAQRR